MTWAHRSADRPGHAVPRRKLVAFERVRLAPGGSAELTLAVPVKRLAVTNGDGDYALYAGRHLLIASRGGGRPCLSPQERPPGTSRRRRGLGGAIGPVVFRRSESRQP